MKSEAQVLPKHLELEDFRRSIHRKMWTVIGVLGIVSLGSLGLALIALARPIPVVVFDSAGRPILFADTVSPRIQMDNLRIEHFAKAFLEKWALVDAANVSDNFADAANMLTPRYRRMVLNDTDELKRRENWKSLNMKSRFVAFEPKIGEYDPKDVDGRIFLIVRGQIRFRPQVGGLEEDELVKYAFAEIVLQRVPVTKQSIHGLLVDHTHTKFFESAEDLDVYALKRP